jgi:hypothetical protein
MSVWTRHRQNRPATLILRRSALSLLLALCPRPRWLQALDFKDLDDELLLRSGNLDPGADPRLGPAARWRGDRDPGSSRGRADGDSQLPRRDNVQELRYRGDLQLAEAEKRLGAGAIESAWEALQQLGAELPDWREPPTRVAAISAWPGRSC